MVGGEEMSFADKKGIVVASGFKLQAEALLDARQQVDTIVERDELVTINAATPGLRVYVKAEKKSYVYNGESWDELTVGVGYTHPTGDGYHHVPATGTSNNGKFLGAGSTPGSESWKQITKSDIVDFPTSMPTEESLVVQFNGGTNEGTDQFTFDGSEAKSVNITPASIGAAEDDHTHTTDNITDFEEAVQGLIPEIPTKLPNPHTLTFTGAVTGSYDGSSEETINIPASQPTENSLIIKLNGGTTEGNNQFTFNGSEAKSVNITPASIGAATSNHSHTPESIGAAEDDHTHTATDITDFEETVQGLLPEIPTKLPNPYTLTFTGAVTGSYDGSSDQTINIPTSGSTDGSLIVKLNGGTIEGTDMFTFNGSTTKNIDITPTSIGAAAADHDHVSADITDLEDTVAGLIPTKLPNPYTLTFTGAVNETYDGSANKTINIPTSGTTDETLIVQFNGGTSEGVDHFTFDGSASKTVNINPLSIGAAEATHDHNLSSTTDPGFLRELTGNTSQYMSGDGTWQNMSLTTFGVTATADELNYMDGITSNVQNQLNNKAASNHTHNYAGSSTPGGSATSANKVNVPVGTILYSISNSTAFFSSCFGGTWEVLGNMKLYINGTGTTLYMHKKIA